VEHEGLIQGERFAAVSYKPTSYLCLQPEFLPPNSTTRLFPISFFQTILHISHHFNSLYFFTLLSPLYEYVLQYIGLSARAAAERAFTSRIRHHRRHIADIAPKKLAEANRSYRQVCLSLI
jgi:hypothetical protein